MTSGHRVDGRGAIRGQPPVVHRTTPSSFRRWGRRGTTPRCDTHCLRCDDDGLSPVHSPYYCYQPLKPPGGGKGRFGKSRGGGEPLADAWARAGGGATSRTGTLPVLSGLRLEVKGDELSVT